MITFTASFDNVQLIFESLGSFQARSIKLIVSDSTRYIPKEAKESPLLTYDEIVKQKSNGVGF